MTRAGVVGHVEWVEFARVARVPHAGEIVHASDFFAEPGGGGAVAAVQLRRLAGAAIFLTALGRGADAERAGSQLRERHGVTVHAGVRPEAQRRTFTFLDDDAERTITVLGGRIVPHRDDPLPWDELGELDAVYFTGGDAAAVRAARAARVLVATPRAMGALARSGVRLDVLVGSANDRGEAYEPGMLDPQPRVVVRTRGAEGGTWSVGGECVGDGGGGVGDGAMADGDRGEGKAGVADGDGGVGDRGDGARGAGSGGVGDRGVGNRVVGGGGGSVGDGGTGAGDGGDAPPVPWLPPGQRSGSWRAAPLPGAEVDAYGCGDSFAAGLAFGLGAGMMLGEAIELAARCGAACLCGRGPYGAMLDLTR